ncbi:hypothetical protein B296_00041869 [Ensete ventricosum]|uniref:Uncharacterized protein n=1 Tax=Ensete ventricosum TaxID=4639 RepID=A0A426YHK8_ENSVE|nr:hypothetical protein B296_00041869 [Ensete ventricosum]
MAKPSTKVVGHGQAPYRGGQPRLDHLQGGNQLWPRPLAEANNRRGSHLQHNAHPQRWPPTSTAPVGGPMDQVTARGEAPSP